MDRNGYKVPRNVHDIATRAMRPFTMPENFSMLERIVRKLTTLFRAHVTGPFLPFHLRNLLNGISNSVFYGAYDPTGNLATRYTKPIVQADKLRRGLTIENISKEIPRFREDGLSDEAATAQLAEWAFVHGVVGERIGISSEYLGETVNRYSSQYPGQNKEVDPIRYLLTAGRKGGISPAPPGTTWPQAANPTHIAGGMRPELAGEYPYVGLKEYDDTRYFPLRLGSDMSSQIEDYNRLSKFIAFLKQGYSPKAAADQVKKIEVDYSNLTMFEKRFARVLFPFYCVPTDHEILTREGWKHYKELVVGEDVLAYDVEKDATYWKPLLEVAEFDYDGELMQWETSRKGKKVGFQFTPNHRWPVEYAQRARASAEDRAGGVVTKTAKCKPKRKIVEGMQLKMGYTLIGAATTMNDEESILTPRQAAILGWVVTDGYHRWRGGHCEMMVYQSPKKYLSEVQELLGTKSRKPHPTTGVICVPVSLEDTRAITKYFKSKKDLPSIVTRLSAEAADEMLQAMDKAESSRTKSNINFSQDPEHNQKCVMHIRFSG